MSNETLHAKEGHSSMPPPQIRLSYPVLQVSGKMSVADILHFKLSHWRIEVSGLKCAKMDSRSSFRMNELMIENKEEK